jgi:hypothetical protein
VPRNNEAKSKNATTAAAQVSGTHAGKATKSAAGSALTQRPYRKSS